MEAAAHAFERSEVLARAIAYAALVLNALEGQARVALARGDAPRSQALAERLVTEAGGDAGTATSRLAGTYEHLIRLTLHRVWAGVDAQRAAAWLTRAQAALIAEADRIHDAALRRSFLTRIDEHGEIVEQWLQQG